MIKTVFWNVNTQEDFFSDGPMKIPNSESIRPKLRALTEFAREKKIKDGTNFIGETVIDGDYFLIKPDAPYIVFPEIHKHRNILLFKNEMSIIEGNKFADSVLNNLGTVMMQRPDYVLYGIGAGLIARELAKRGYDVKVVVDATIEFNNLPIDYEEIGIGQITTESIFSLELV